MKKTATLLIIGLFAFGNISIGNAKTYRAAQTNSEGQVITVTISEGDNQKVIEPLKQFSFKYNSEGLPVEKIIYNWNSEEAKWVENSAYKYVYGNTKQLIVLQYTKWDNKRLAWSNTESSFPIDGLNEKLLTINYLETLEY